MSSDGVQSVLAQQRLNDYGSLVIVVAISYDYCLTFSREVTYIWQRPWTWVSSLYLLIRYAGYLSVIVAALIGSTFVPGPVEVLLGVVMSLAFHFTSILGSAFYLLGTWAYPIFWAGADLVMILRVYAMYNRSKFILGVLLVMYAVELVMLFLSSGFYSDPKYVMTSVAQVLNISVCNIAFSTQMWNNGSTIAQFILGTVMCILVAAQFARHVLQVHRSGHAWQMNKYMRLLIRDSLLYFLVSMWYSLINMLGILGVIPVGWATQVLMAATNVPLYTLTPRFVMNVRELYASDLEGFRDRDIDSGFGFSGRANHANGSTTLGTIAFGDVSGMDPSEEPIAMVEERTEEVR